MVLSRLLHDDRFAAPVRALMGKTVQTTASSVADRGHCKSLLHSDASVTKSSHLMPNVTVTSFVGTNVFLSRPLHDDRFAAPVRELMGKTVQTTSSSAADRGLCQPFLRHSASVTKSFHLMPNVTVAPFVGRDGG